CRARPKQYELAVGDEQPRSRRDRSRPGCGPASPEIRPREGFRSQPGPAALPGLPLGAQCCRYGRRHDHRCRWCHEYRWEPRPGEAFQYLETLQAGRQKRNLPAEWAPTGSVWYSRFRNYHTDTPRQVRHLRRAQILSCRSNIRSTQAPGLRTVHHAATVGNEEAPGQTPGSKPNSEGNVAVVLAGSIDPIRDLVAAIRSARIGQPCPSTRKTEAVLPHPHATDLDELFLAVVALLLRSPTYFREEESNRCQHAGHCHDQLVHTISAWAREVYRCSGATGTFPPPRIRIATPAPAPRPGYEASRPTSLHHPTPSSA